MYSFKITTENFRQVFLCYESNTGRYVLPVSVTTPLYPRYIFNSIKKWETYNNIENKDKMYDLLESNANNAGVLVAKENIYFSEYHISKTLYLSYLQQSDNRMKHENVCKNKIF